LPQLRDHSVSTPGQLDRSLAWLDRFCGRAAFSAGRVEPVDQVL
jgi:hypothetical protein